MDEVGIINTFDLIFNEISVNFKYRITIEFRRRKQR